MKDFLTLAEASKITGYHQDYLGYLCRVGKLEGQKIGRAWVTTTEAIQTLMGSDFSVPTSDPSREPEQPLYAKVSPSAPFIQSQVKSESLFDAISFHPSHVEGLPIAIREIPVTARTPRTNVHSDTVVLSTQIANMHLRMNALHQQMDALHITVHEHTTPTPQDMKIRYRVPHPSRRFAPTLPLVSSDIYSGDEFSVSPNTVLKGASLDGVSVKKRLRTPIVFVLAMILIAVAGGAFITNSSWMSRLMQPDAVMVTTDDTSVLRGNQGSVLSAHDKSQNLGLPDADTTPADFVTHTNNDDAALAVNGNTTVHGNLAVTSDSRNLRVAAQTAADNGGYTTIAKGATSVRVSFNRAYANAPVVTVTPTEFVQGAYRVTATDTDGFTIELSTTQSTHINFNWISFSK